MPPADHALGALIGAGEVAVFGGLALWLLWRVLGARRPPRGTEDDLMDEKQ